MQHMIENYYAGTSGLLLPVPNKLYYPKAFQEKSRLCYYASLMNSIEINSSFYKIPLAATVNRWAQEVPESFKFSFKLFKGITHQKDLIFDPPLVNKFFSVIDHIDQKKGCLLVQFPPSIRKAHMAQLRYLMTQLRENDRDFSWKIALEFRHPSLYCQEIYDLLESHQFGMVLHDKTHSASPMRDSAADFIYVRFHGPDGNYKGTYSEELLHEYASYVAEWLQEGKKVFVYFNNTMGEALGNLVSLQEAVLNV